MIIDTKTAQSTMSDTVITYSETKARTIIASAQTAHSSTLYSGQKVFDLRPTSTETRIITASKSAIKMRAEVYDSVILSSKVTFVVK